MYYTWNLKAGKDRLLPWQQSYIKRKVWEYDYLFSSVPLAINSPFLVTEVGFPSYCLSWLAKQAIYRHLFKGSCLFPEACESAYRHSVRHTLPCAEMASSWDNAWPEKTDPHGNAFRLTNLSSAPHNMAGQHISPNLAAPGGSWEGRLWGMLIKPISCQDKQSQITGRGSHPGAIDNVAVIPGCEESDLSWGLSHRWGVSWGGKWREWR